MNKQASPRAALLMLLICVFCWGSVFPIAKIILDSMSGLSLVIWRFLIAAICLTLYLLVRRIRWPALSIGQYAILGGLGVIGVGGFNLALFEGLPYTDPTNGALIMALSPMTTSVLAALLARRWLSVQQWISLALGLSGVILVITGGNLQQFLQQGVNHGDMLIVGGMVCWSVFTVLSQRVTHWLPPIPFTLVTMIGGWLSMLLFGLFKPDLHPLTELQQLQGTTLLQILYVGLFGTVVAYLFWIRGVMAIGAASASLFFNLVPVFAALIAVTLGHAVTLIQVTGMVIVVGGLTLPPLVTRLLANNRSLKLQKV
jgi:drug/metabolite transporter (DMT)-like permease